MNQEVINKLLAKLEEKYSPDNQKVEDYLEGLVHQRYLDYWDYINLDVLLNLQTPRTNHPDEYIFIMYHQITELYFNLIVREIDQILNRKPFDISFFKKRLERVVGYFNHLSDTFKVMTFGMEPEQFLAFRMSLLPASGFQSAQYRKIEIMSAPLAHLIDARKREDFRNSDFNNQLDYLYWRFGATINETGEKALTLKRFEHKYNKAFQDFANTYKANNLFLIVTENFDEIKLNPDVISLLRKFDYIANVKWPMVHYGTATRYLESAGTTKTATGGTNWKTYMLPKNQQIRFFPLVWSEDEIKNWGEFTLET